MVDAGLPKYEYFNVSMPAEYVAHVEINRASKMNAFIEPMWQEIRQVFDALSMSPTVRAVIFSGGGERAFSSGLDVTVASQASPLSAQQAPDAARRALANRRHINDFQACISAVERCEKPVICALHGYAFGLAIDLSSCADVRICAQGTRFSVKEVDIGLAADVGTLTRLPKIVGSYSWVKDVCLSARVFGPDEALQHGFVTAVHPSKEETLAAALRWAELVAAKSPVAVQSTKELLDWSRDHTVQDGLRYTSVWNGAALQTADVAASMKAGIQKRKPTFEKL